MILYSYFRSSCSWRVRIALAYKGINYETVGIDILKGEQNKPEFLKVNPMGQVPALLLQKSSQTALIQSMAIMEYLEEAHPQKPLLPKDPIARAQVRGICELISSGIQPLQNLSAIKLHSQDPEERVKWARHWIEKGFIALEKILRETSGEFCFEDNFSMADCTLVPQIANARRFQCSLAQCPVINGINERLQGHPAVEAAHPSLCPDYQIDEVKPEE